MFVGAFSRCGDIFDLLMQSVFSLPFTLSLSLTFHQPDYTGT